MAVLPLTVKTLQNNNTKTEQASIFPSVINATATEFSQITERLQSQQLVSELSLHLKGKNILTQGSEIPPTISLNYLIILAEINN